jgi:5'-3' exonuclease
VARLHLVDGTFELFRAHFSPRPGRTDAAGADVKATVGVVSSLLSLLADEQEDVTHLAVAFDNPIESFRNELFVGYKDSTGVEATLLAQFDRVERAVAATGVVVWSMAEHEADDALATAAVRYAGEFDQIRILTPDKDLGQCVRGQQIVQVDRMRDREFDEDGVVQRLGVRPTQVPDYLALVGDTADGIPGVRGFGARTVASLLAVFPHLEDIPDSAEGWPDSIRGAPRLAETLRDHRDDIALYRRLATLVTDVPLAEDADDLRFTGTPRDTFLAICDDLDAETLRERPDRWR